MKNSQKLRIRTASLLAATGAATAFTLIGAASVASAATTPSTPQVTQVASEDQQYSAEQLGALNAEADKQAEALKAAGIPFEVISESDGVRWVDVTSSDQAVLDKADEIFGQLLGPDGYFAADLIETNAETDKVVAALQTAGIPVNVTTDAGGMHLVEINSNDQSVIDKADTVLGAIESEELATNAD